MQELADLRRQRVVVLLAPLFFLSGATALVYQILWVRQLHLVFGTSQFAVATVLAAFMGGLATGGFWAARSADHLLRPLARYAWLELAIGAYALIFPLLLDVVTPGLLAFHRAVGPGPLLFGAVEFLLVAVLLLVPTTCMGATLPLLARFATARRGEAGAVVGWLYGINTFGAVAGVGLAGFWLLSDHGLRTTTLVAAAANGLLGLGALVLSHQGGDVPRAAVSDEAPRRLRALLGVAALSGFAALVYELAWFRLMALILGGSTYAFSVMLIAFLVGIAGGGWIAGPPADRAMARHGPSGPLVALAAVQVGIAVLTWTMMWAWQELPFAFVGLYDAVEGADTLIWAATLFLAAGVMAPPALLMGATFTLLVRTAIGGERDPLGRAVGRLYGANTLGGIAGAALGGFVLLPWLDLTGAVRVAGTANLAGAALAAWGVWATASRSSRLGGALTGAALLAVGVLVPPPWNPLLMTAGMYKYVSDLEDHSREGILEYAVTGYRLLFYDEGLSTVVTVAQSRQTGNIWLANNGKVDASSTVDMPTQVLVSHLPMLFAPRPRKALVIGLASGISAGALTLYDELETIEVVELEPAIVEAARFFDDYNHRLLDDPRVRVIANDGRNHLLLAPPGSLDVVVSEPSNPWISGVSNLFTREFFETGLERLSPDGVWGQWVQMYGMDDGDLRTLLGTFSDVFPHVALFAAAEDADLVLVGSRRPLTLDPYDAAALLEDDLVRQEELRAIGVVTPYDLLAYFQMDGAALRELSDGVPRNTDDNMRIEFSAPRNLHRETVPENLAVLYEHLQSPWLGTVEHGLGMGRAYAGRKEWVRALIAIREVLAVEPEHPEAVALRVEWAKSLKEALDGGEEE